MHNNLYENRHIGINLDEQNNILSALGYTNIDNFINDVIPSDIISDTKTTLEDGLEENIALARLRQFANKNKVYKNYIGMGYYDTITPSVIKRNVFENPGWYTAYTPYQAEISQGRLEALLNFQQMIMDLTGFNLANASLLDEATAAAESMSMARRLSKSTSNKFFVANNIFSQTLDVIRTRARYQNIEVVIGNIAQVNAAEYFGIFIQNPDLYGTIQDYTDRIKQIKQQSSECIITMACDIMSLVLFKSPSTMGADIAVGSTQRFGIPIGFGGPSAAYIATSEANKRIMPGRIIGVTKDNNGKNALRMSLQTREQHIRREKATSNICTAQALLANMAAFYAIYHGRDGLCEIAKRINNLALLLAHNLKQAGILLKTSTTLFDTVAFQTSDVRKTYDQLLNSGYVVGIDQNQTLFISVGESSSIVDIVEMYNIITNLNITQDKFINNAKTDIQIYDSLMRTDAILTHKIFNCYHSETKMMRYLKKLENRDISLVHSMIPLGSCTMKLNAASTLEGVSWPEFANIHPFAPTDASIGYIELLDDLKLKLAKITGFSDVSLQPNSGAQGEFAGLITITRYQESLGQGHRNICLIPKSAHGTNPATAQMVGLTVVVVDCDTNGNVDMNDLKAKATQYKDSLACLMITYPSTHGVFEANIKQICSIIHENGGQVYMDGANLNAMVGLVKPAELGADVSHINLHKTFAIPHGGGGPGMGPIGVKPHLAKFLPTHVYNNNEDVQQYAVSSSPFGSASILIIPLL
ncbi:MAG: aminomethyl-transferring glycine dehydrogenase [Neisseriaceae bacterium]